MKFERDMLPYDIAPCGVNCMACSARLDKKKPCPGCRAPVGLHTRVSCMNCAKKACAFEKGLTWCFECEEFPCERIENLNVRYLTNCGVNLVENGERARTDIDAFLAQQKDRFECARCGGVINQHQRRCSECGQSVAC